MLYFSNNYVMYPLVNGNDIYNFKSLWHDVCYGSVSIGNYCIVDTYVGYLCLKSFDNDIALFLC